MLGNKFSQIFAIRRHKDISVYESFKSNGGTREWYVKVIRNLNYWEVDEYITLPNSLVSISLNENEDQSV